MCVLFEVEGMGGENLCRFEKHAAEHHQQDLFLQFSPKSLPLFCMCYGCETGREREWEKDKKNSVYFHFVFFNLQTECGCISQFVFSDKSNTLTLKQSRFEGSW